jgi:hypothetical protein
VLRCYDRVFVADVFLQDGTSERVVFNWGDIPAHEKEHVKDGVGFEWIALQDGGAVRTLGFEVRA